MTDFPRSPAPPPLASAARDVYSVSRLNREARLLLEQGLPPLWIEGEISNLARPASGHLYFSLKDRQAQVRCAMFRSRQARAGFVPTDGAQVLVRARVSLYEPRGEFQLLVEHLEPAGEGALRLAFEALKRKLAAEGLFAAERKLPLPPFPRCIGVLTSPSGAALRDVLSVLRRRCPALPVIVYPVPVQGAGSAARIEAMLERAGARGECDVLVLTRGGGSLEDLWAFNDEALARRIAACPVSVVTGIGHEIDFTIADFAADLRAPTPSAAAELVSPDASELAATCAGLLRRLELRLRERLVHARQRLDSASGRLLHPGRRLQQMAQRTDELYGRLVRSLSASLRARRAALQALRIRLRRAGPRLVAAACHQRLASARQRLALAARQHLARLQARLQALERALRAVGPQATLARGYAIVQRADDGRVLRSAGQVEAGERVRTRLARGSFTAVVDEVAVDPAPDTPAR